MNAALRSVVRSANFHSIECVGFYRGYQGLIENSYKPLQMRSVSNILELGGTFLRTARSLDFHNPKVREKAYKNLKLHNIDALVVIGGNQKVVLEATDEIRVETSASNSGDAFLSYIEQT